MNAENKKSIPEIEALINEYGDFNGFVIIQTPYADGPNDSPHYTARAISPKAQAEIAADIAADSFYQDARGNLCIKTYADCTLTWEVADRDAYESGDGDCCDWDDFTVRQD